MAPKGVRLREFRVWGVGGFEVRGVFEFTLPQRLVDVRHIGQVMLVLWLSGHRE